MTRSRLPIEIHHAVFGFVLEIVERHGLVRGRRIGVDASTQEANAALRRLVRRDTGEDYRQMLERLAKDSGIETPSTEDLIRFDRTRKGKSLSNAEWASPTDPEARIAKMKDGTTHLAYKLCIPMKSATKGICQNNRVIRPQLAVGDSQARAERLDSVT